MPSPYPLKFNNFLNFITCDKSKNEELLDVKVFKEWKTFKKLYLGIIKIPRKVAGMY